MAFGKKSKGKSGGSFKYQARDADAYASRQNVGGMREGFIADGVKMFSPKEGDHSVRILPPGWDDAKYYGIDAYVHYDIGPDGGAYLCLDQMRSSLEKAGVDLEVPEGDCAICAARKQAVADGEDEELIRALGWTRRVLCYVIDRNNEGDGPLLWSMPQTLDKEIAAQCVNKKTGEVYPLDDDQKGYDVSFERVGTKQKTKYTGVQLDRNSSPLSDDEDEAADWLKFVVDNPLPSQLVFQDADYIETLVSGGPRAAARRAGKQQQDDDKDTSRRRRANKDKDDDEEEEETPRRAGTRPKLGKKKGKAETTTMTWKEVHALDEDELVALAEEHDVDIEDADNEEEAADKICSELGIEKPGKSARKKAEEDEEEEEEEEDERPARRGGGKRAKQEEEEEEEEDEPPAKSSRLAKLKKKMASRK